MRQKSILIIGLLTFVFIIYFFKPKISLAPQILESPNATQKEQKEEIQIPKLSIGAIFDDKLDTEGLDQSKIIRLIATGDVIPARGANWPSVTSGDFTYNWKKTASFLKNGDITLINLESPLTKNCPLINEGFTFCGDARHVQGILYSEVDSVSISNNHIGNFGQEGINETTSLLEKNKLGWSGFGHLDTQTVKGIRFGFLAYNGVGQNLDLEKIKSEIKTHKSKVYILVVSIHWGDEYVLVPRAYGNIAPDDPKKVGPELIDAGADLIIGNHPHWVQGVQIHEDKLIAYAHGNFIFDQTWSKETQEGVVGEYLFYIDDKSKESKKVNLIDALYHPILVDKSYQPRFLSKKSGQHILDRMLKSSNLISSNK
ncbi:MAG: CapA family protein [Candidatus Woykebacteria bacterium]